MSTLVSGSTSVPGAGGPTQEFEPLLEIETGFNAFQAHTKLNHGKRHFRLDSDDDYRRTAESYRVCDTSDRSGGKRIEDIERGHIDDNATSAKSPDPIGEIVTKLFQIAIGQRRLD
jgi:hypothetical protein